MKHLKGFNEIKHNDFDEEEEQENIPYGLSVAREVEKQHKYSADLLVKLAFQAGMDYISAIESPNKEDQDSAEDFDTWWAKYNKKR